jgi:cell division septation protein DedD
MENIKFGCLTIIALFLISTFVLVTVNAQSTEFTNYTIKPDGSVEPNNSVITHTGNNYFLTQNITGSLIIQRDDAVFDGSGYTVTGNAEKGTYNLDDSVLYLDAGVNLTRAWNVTVQNVRVENSVNGITLVNAYYCRVLNCTIVENAVDGMKIAWSSKNMVFWNEIKSNGDDAIQLFNADNNNIMVNNMDPGEYYRVNGNGLQLNGNCSTNKIAGNNVTAFDTGIYIDSSGGNLTANIVSYNNFSNNVWNGAAVGGTDNVVTLNNFYNNGLISEGDNNCSGNYWNTTPSTFDLSPLNSPVNTNITPEFILIPVKEPEPTPTPTASPTAAPTYTPPTSAAPTATPVATPTKAPTPTETTEPTATSTPEPTKAPTQVSAAWPIPLIALFIISIVAVVPVIAFRGKIIKRTSKGFTRTKQESKQDINRNPTQK